MSLSLAQESYDLLKMDIDSYLLETKSGIHNPALVALGMLFLGEKVNTEAYVNRRIEIERSQKRR